MPFPVDEKYIIATEEKMGVIFPKSFREKMLHNNGGEVDTSFDIWQLYPFFDTSDKKRLSRTCNDIVRETEAARKWLGFPERAVAIGTNGAGDQLIFLLSEDGINLQSEVFWWNHEIGEVEKLAEKFDDLNNL